MKVEVINLSTREIIETYSVPNLSMFDFQEWNGKSEDIIHLDCLSDAVKNLDSKDDVTQEPLLTSTEVDLYLPDPLKDQALRRFAKSQIAQEESSEQFADKLDQVTEQVSEPELKSSIILSAVVKEIVQNHHPNSDYEVRISDG